ncbi:MAG: hypothetical protein CMO80_24490 [Verrucomicrobiales bacterium]|nr:hypothetical protein [Verrucomicrobiales bacterium]
MSDTPHQPETSDPQADPRSGAPPVHPLAALLLLVVDNLWNLGDWAVFAWIIIIPLSFLSVFFPGIFLQRYANHDGWGKSIGKSMMLGVLAAIPTSIAGTPIGVAFLAWAGMDRWRSRKDLLTNPIGALSGQGNMPSANPAQVVAQVSQQPPPAPSPASAQVIDVEATTADHGASQPQKQTQPSEPAFSSPPDTPPGTPPQPTRPPEEPLLPPPNKASKLGVLALCLVLIAMCFGAMIYLMEFATEKVEKWADKAAKVFPFLQRPPIAEAFTASLPELSRTEGGDLHVASFKVSEQISQTDFVYKNLMEVKSEIRVPVTYQYFVRLRDKWEISVTNGICWVTTPRLRPNDPIIHTDKMHKTRNDSFFVRDGVEEEMMDALERSLSKRFWVNSSTPEYLKMVREDSRLTVGEFVKDWILAQDRWKDYNIHTVKIVFPDEVGSEEAKLLPTLLIEKER